MGQNGLKRYVEFVNAGGSIHRVPLNNGYLKESELPKDVCYYRYINSHSITGPAENDVQDIYVGRVITCDEVCAEFPHAEGLIETMKEERLSGVLLTADGHFRKITEGMRVIDRGKPKNGDL